MVLLYVRESLLFEFKDVMCLLLNVGFSNEYIVFLDSSSKFFRVYDGIIYLFGMLLILIFNV